MQSVVAGDRGEGCSELLLCSQGLVARAVRLQLRAPASSGPSHKGYHTQSKLSAPRQDGALSISSFTTHHHAHVSTGLGVIVCLGNEQEIPLDSDLPALLFGWPVVTSANGLRL